MALLMKMKIKRTSDTATDLRTLHFAMLAAGSMLITAFAASAQPAVQPLPPPASTPSPFATGGSASAITSSSANGETGAAPVVPKAADVRRESRIDATAAEAAAERGSNGKKAPVMTEQENKPVQR